MGAGMPGIQSETAVHAIGRATLVSS
jgi:hypothetical protein